MSTDYFALSWCFSLNMKEAYAWEADLRCIHTDRKRKQKRKFSLMFVVYSFIFFTFSSIYIAFSSRFRLLWIGRYTCEANVRSHIRWGGVVETIGRRDTMHHRYLLYEIPLLNRRADTTEKHYHPTTFWRTVINDVAFSVGFFQCKQGLADVHTFVNVFHK